MKKYHSICLFLILTSFCSFAMFAQTSIRLESSSQVQVGSEISIIVKIDSVEELHAYSVRISYDNTIVQILSITKKDFLASHQTFYYKAIDSVNNIIKVDEAILGTATQSGSGSLVEITALALTEGVADFTFTVSDLRNQANDSIAHTSTGCNVSVTSVVNVEDFVYTKPVFALLNNYPNPFNPSTKINFSLSEPMNINISVYSITGELVATIFNGYCPEGIHSELFKAENFTSGFYIVRLTGKDFSDSIKILLVK